MGIKLTPKEAIANSPFKATEFNNLHRMDADFLAQIVAWRLWHGFPCMITSDYRESATSTHGKGLALDIVMYEPKQWKAKQPNWFTIFTTALQGGFSGVGIYFDWTVDGRKVIGLHVDNGREHSLAWIRHQQRYYYFRANTGKFTHSDGRTIEPNQLFNL
jgi:hypothetical protein